MKHSKCLEESMLWKIYTNIIKDDHERIGWTEEAFKSACEQLKAVRDTFDNYTLHDETHVLNVLDAMAGLLGDQVENLTAGESELLILSAAFHDLGMVYSEQDIVSCVNDEDKLRDYYNIYPYLRGSDTKSWDESVQQDYLRWLHPFRVGDVLQQSEWRAHFSKRPKEVASEDVIIAVCRAHGESPDKLRREATEQYGSLKYLRFKDVDPLFCAIILRLADILDFDDSRAPSALFRYAGRSEKSVEEWKKHIASMGFYFSSTPSSDDLPYGAYFTNPTIERAAHLFLDWIDEELSNSRNLLPFTYNRWTSFSFPYKVDRSEIERIGYDYGDFKITMDQSQIMEFLIGENLYDDRSVFVRELLQNSIDATLLRAEMDSEFAKKINTDEARIDLWEWWDDNGDLWFRIDDRGTGMTRGMLEKYFLKAGNSYYNSQELKRDLNGKSFSGISRFGIGFLSSFLCGREAYVSTTYWNSEKNIREAERDKQIHVTQGDFGLRLDVTGLKGYYTMRNQAIPNNFPNALPAPPLTVPHPDSNYEKDGYRTLPGTSIAILLDPGKLGARSLLEVAKHWTCFPRMPIYYNDKRLCMTQDELVALAKTEQGDREYELSDDEKKRFDDFLPEFNGNYPRIMERIELFEAEQVPGLPKLKIVLCETKVLISDGQRVNRDGSSFLVTGRSPLHKPVITIYHAGEIGEDLTLSLQAKDSRRLFDILLSNKEFTSSIHYGWKGIFAFHKRNLLYNNSPTILVIDEDEGKPDLNVNRELLISLPLKTSLTINTWLEKHLLKEDYYYRDTSFEEVPLKEWRTIISSEFNKWIDVESWDMCQAFIRALENGISSDNMLPKELAKYRIESSLFWKDRFSSDIRWLFLAYLQIHYRIVVDYSNQNLKFYEIDSIETETRFDLFPPMPFCYGEGENSSILCSSNSNQRLAITANHCFTKWLIKNAKNLYEHYPRQFEQIIYGLQFYNADKLIPFIDLIREQLSKTAYRYGIDVSDCPKLTMEDFWMP